MLYALDRISRQPAHGYEIIQAIDNLTGGAWKPGASAVYPMFKKMVAHGLVVEEERGRDGTQRFYRITPKGTTFLHEGKKAIANASRRFSPMLKIFYEITDPEDLGRIFVEGRDTQFRLTREMIEGKILKLPTLERGFLLREYALQLERELNWVTSILDELPGSVAKPSTSHHMTVKAQSK